MVDKNSKNSQDRPLGASREHPIEKSISAPATGNETTGKLRPSTNEEES